MPEIPGVGDLADEEEHPIAEHELVHEGALVEGTVSALDDARSGQGGQQCVPAGVVELLRQQAGGDDYDR